MLFASATVAARVERADACLMRDTALAAGRRRPGTGAFAIPLAGGFATYAAPLSPANKVAGLGFAGPVDPRELDAVERAYAERGAPTNVVVEESRAIEAAAWLDVVITGFASPDLQGVPSHESFPRDELERLIAEMAEADGFARCLARRDGVPAGGASMRPFEGVAQLCGAATLPGHRRRGVQSALLAARLAIAGRAGCDIAVVTTQPGSKSQENVQKLGFELLYTRAILSLRS
jgi:GNAT superfamily N-acetyltransferase